MGWFSKDKKRVMKPLPKTRRIEKRIIDSTGIDDDYEVCDDADTSDTSFSDHIKEFREGIGEIQEMFLTGEEEGGEKFAKFSFGLANLCKYRNTLFDNFVESGMSESSADNALRSIISDAGFMDMMLAVVSYRETKKKRGRSKKR